MTHLDVILTPQISAFPRIPDALALRLQAYLVILRPAARELLTLGAFLAMCVGLMAEFS